MNAFNDKALPDLFDISFTLSFVKFPTIPILMKTSSGIRIARSLLCFSFSTRFWQLWLDCKGNESAENALHARINKLLMALDLLLKLQKIQ